MLNRKHSQDIFCFRLEDLTLKSASNRSESYADMIVELLEVYINI